MTAPLSALIGHMMNAQFALESGTKREAIDILKRGIALARAAQAGEAGTAETVKLGSVHEHAVPQGMRPKPVKQGGEDGS
jgi:hypothetical protein